MGRFTQAISEGDGISVIPELDGDIADLAALAEEAGAEAVAVSVGDAAAACAATTLPIVVDGVRALSEVNELASAEVDGCVFVYDDLAAEEGELLTDLFPAAEVLGTDCAIEVRESDDLAEILEQLDPEILVAASRDPRDEDELEHVLDLLADVPAGKLVVARPRRPVAREQIVALERAGVDAVLVSGESLRIWSDFGAALSELTGR
jgi:indole-3-glycerol phosphate synthase